MKFREQERKIKLKVGSLEGAKLWVISSSLTKFEKIKAHVTTIKNEEANIQPKRH